MSESSSVFISYRRDASAYLAQAIFQDLHANYIDVFYDIESIKAGYFDTILLNQIAARPYFMLVLTPGTLDRCVNQGDWVRREIEYALSVKRRFIPVHTPDFGFADIDTYLTADVAGALKRFNMLEIPHRYFKYAMQEIRTFLVPIALTTEPTSPEAFLAADRVVQQAIREPDVTEQQLTAQAHFEKGKQASTPDEQIAHYSEAIRLNPAFASAYNNRGMAYNDTGVYDKALDDLNKSIQLDPTSAYAYCNRGISWFNKGDSDKALQDFDEALRLDASFASVYTNRGSVWHDKGQYDKALQDYNEALRLNPSYANAYGGRGVTYLSKGESDKAIADFNQAARLNPDYPPIYISRAYAYAARNDLEQAIADGEKALSLQPDAPWAKGLKDDIAKWRAPRKLFGLF
ncbi:MAG: tetratricopeptide repeat protein [Anaerolineae bacterium]|nr:tetratricopeptide repeat protein [Anaerolineae bacterium]